MEIEAFWKKALRETEIIRPRISGLETSSATYVPYIFLAESAVNHGDAVVRQGGVVVEKPSLVLPYNHPRFEGFEFEKLFPEAKDPLSVFFLARGIRFQSLKYRNSTSSLEVFEGGLDKASRYYQELLRRKEDISTGLLTGAEDCWQFSILIFACMQAVKSVDNDIQKLFEEYKKNGS